MPPTFHHSPHNAYFSKPTFGAFWLLLAVGSFFVAGPWAGFHGVLIGGVGVLMWLSPPKVSLPRLWWILAALFLIAGCGVFLPAEWIGVPEWRRNLESLGVDTGSLVVIQSRQAAEMLGLFAIMLLTGLWFAGHRASPQQLRFWALAFTLGVAVYAASARLIQVFPDSFGADATSPYGFFPNRNHTGTYLAMGTICGLGSTLQALRDKRFYVMALSLVATAICIWAVAGWSVSRGGILLVLVGVLVWLPMLGRRYLGKNGLWALALLVIATVGGFFIADTQVKQRILGTLEKAQAISKSDEPSPLDGNSAAKSSIETLDYRIPTALDTLDLIGAFPWTGIGAGQYFYIFPQYRKLTAVANHSDSYHPESDWLWMASEAGIPATLALGTLVLLVFWKSFKGLSHGRDRAIRSACLVAAALVPIHGLFDVPGHRITLAWSAVFLFTLSMRHANQTEIRTPKAWPYRIAALAMLVIAFFLIWSQWGGGPQPAFIAADTARNSALKLYREDLHRQQAAVAKGEEYQPEPSEDLLEKALVILNQATEPAPLDRDLRRLEGFIALAFDDKYQLADQAFAIDRALDPIWVAGPLNQSQAWAPIDPERTVALWIEALDRAAKIDQISPNAQQATKQVAQAIHRIANDNPSLESRIPARIERE